MKNNKILAFLFALVMAFGLWLYVITVVNPEWEETYYNVPVVLDGEKALNEKGLMLISDDEPTVSVKLSGNRSDLNNINSGNLTLIADLSNIKEAGQHILGYTVNYPGNVANGAVTTLEKKPSYITVEVAERISKEVPVQVNYTGELPKDFILDKTTQVLSNDTVMVIGPKETVEQIHHASITVDCTDETESIIQSYRYYLCNEADEPVDVELVDTNVEEIRLEVKISRVKKVPLVLTIHAGGGATEETSKIVIEPEQISVSGSNTALENLTEINLGTINLGDVLNPLEQEYDIVLPEGIKNESSTTTAKVSISFPDLAKKDFTVTAITPINVAEGMEAEVLTQQMQITVRGPKAQIQQLTLEDIQVRLDLTGITSTAAVEPIITFADGFPDVGVVGKYSITVTVNPPEE